MFVQLRILRFVSVMFQRLTAGVALRSFADAAGADAEVVGISRNRISEIVGNTIYGNVDTLLSQGHDMDYTACASGGP